MNSLDRIRVSEYRAELRAARADELAYRCDVCRIMRGVGFCLGQWACPACFEYLLEREQIEPIPRWRKR